MTAAELLQTVSEQTTPEMSQHVTSAVLGLAGLAAGYLGLRALVGIVRLGSRLTWGAVRLAERVLCPEPSPLCVGVLVTLDESTAVLESGRLKTSGVVCDFSFRTIKVKGDSSDISPLLSRRDLASIWRRAESVRAHIEDRENDALRQMYVEALTTKGVS